LSFWYGYRPGWSWLLFPVVGLAAWILAVSAGLAAACLTALLRDIKNVVPFLVQVWIYASPVFYPIDLLPPALRPFAGLNPVAGVLGAFRACLFGTPPDWRLLGQSALALFALACGSIWLFHHVEDDLAERV
jgi:homopolymeric O-antigen transport system permease protein